MEFTHKAVKSVKKIMRQLVPLFKGKENEEILPVFT